MTLQEWLERAGKEGWALPHFNISDAITLRAICMAAKNLKSPIMIGTSEGERKFIGAGQAVALVRAFQEEYGIPIFLNADHHKSAEAAKEAIDAGYDSVHIDLSRENNKKNFAGTKEVVEYAKAKNPDISVEGELGYLPTESSKIYKEVVEVDQESLTKPEEAAEFVKKTGVDRFAPAVGNLHGIAANEPKLDFQRIEAIRSALPDDVALVLHGGSGISDEDIKKAIQAGINNIHINTELRVVYRKALEEFFKQNPDETTPYKFLKAPLEAMQRKAEEKLRLFGAVRKIEN